MQKADKFQEQNVKFQTKWASKWPKKNPLWTWITPKKGGIDLSRPRIFRVRGGENKRSSVCKRGIQKLFLQGARESGEKSSILKLVDNSRIGIAPERQSFLGWLPFLKATNFVAFFSLFVAVHRTRGDGVVLGVHGHAVAAGVVHHNDVSAFKLWQGHSVSQKVTLK